MKERELEALMDGLTKGLRPIFLDLEKRIRKLESAQGPQAVADSFQGTWRKSLKYRRGSLVTHKGCLWLSESDNSNEPGSGPDWRLTSKGGEAPRT